VARYQLRRRADTDSFTYGIRMARRDAVTFELIAPNEVKAQVRDPETDAEPLAVRIVVDGSELAGACPCDVAAERICWHQVAVAHALWARDRRRYGRIR
jgi:uncharacterized Zn finger protein